MSEDKNVRNDLDMNKIEFAIQVLLNQPPYLGTVEWQAEKVVKQDM